MTTANFRVKTLALALTLALVGCGESTSSSQGEGFNNGGDQGVITNPTTFDEAGLVASLVDNVITPAYSLFYTQAQAQRTAIADYCALEQASIESSSEQALAAMSTAQNAWLDTMGAWQQVEVMQMGPLLSNSGELRNRIYSWPAISRCGIDQDVAYHQDGVINLDPNRPYDISTRTATRRGLFALQHVLFNPQYDHHCSIANEALADWNSLTELDRKVARCEYAVTAADDLIVSAEELLNKWQGDNGFAAQLKSAGEPNSQFENAHVALNHISDAMFYLTEMVKDKKLAEPIGILPNSCGTSACAEDVESLDAKSSLANIQANLLAFEALLVGQQQGQEALVGFDNYLDEEQATATKERMLQAISETKAAIAAIDSSLASALIDNEQQVRDVHTKVKAITDELKNDFINELALELPATSAGDND
ncbi:imelysin family protein [Pseudoalteromonas sp. YIC-827]|uniref:Imelysin family protein n=1 Tax=Pseudoalteromonas qingdaonensis TaxID=3131913 RepID=A0ABU9MYR2_9GAMM